MTQRDESDRPRTLIARDLQPGMALEMTPTVFWDVLAVELDEERGVKVQLVHDRRYTFDPDAVVRVLG